MTRVNPLYDRARSTARAQCAIFPAKLPWDAIGDLIPFPAFAAEHADEAIRILERERFEFEQATLETALDVALR